MSLEAFQNNSFIGNPFFAKQSPSEKRAEEGKCPKPSKEKIKAENERRSKK